MPSISSVSSPASAPPRVSQAGPSVPKPKAAPAPAQTAVNDHDADDAAGSTQSEAAEARGGIDVQG